MSLKSLLGLLLLTAHASAFKISFTKGFNNSVPLTPGEQHNIPIEWTRSPGDPERFLFALSMVMEPGSGNVTTFSEQKGEPQQTVATDGAQKGEYEIVLGGFGVSGTQWNIVAFDNIASFSDIKIDKNPFFNFTEVIEVANSNSSGSGSTPSGSTTPEPTAIGTPAGSANNNGASASVQGSNMLINMWGMVVAIL